MKGYKKEQKINRLRVAIKDNEKRMDQIQGCLRDPCAELNFEQLGIHLYESVPDA